MLSELEFGANMYPQLICETEASKIQFAYERVGGGNIDVECSM